MDGLFAFALHNTLAALAFALVAIGVTRMWRNPPLAHALWLVVLLRLVAPPIAAIDCAAFLPVESTQPSAPPTAAASEIEQASPQPGLVEQATARTTDGTAPRILDRVQLLLSAIWIGGAAACALVVAARIVRFELRLRDALPASRRLRQLAAEIASRVGVSRVPDVRCVESVDAPLLWCAGGRPTIVLPARLLAEQDDERMALILAHELAHLRRRDHWVRFVELLVSIAYWWNPLAWAIRRQIHRAEDSCCDAWVCRLFPESAKRYAEVLFEAAESLGDSSLAARLLPACLFLRPFSLKARIEMILENRFTPFVSKKSLFALALFALIALPLGVRHGKTARAGSRDEAPAAPARNSEKPSSEFPYAVQFEQGATRFADGDKITILEVRGTAETFAPGNIYWIKGAYKLASRNKAALAAFTTAMDAEHGTGSYLKVQSTVVDRGEGTFTLFLPMTCRGWPHVSFYPAEGGEGFGGNYFGTGESVLKKGWGEKEAD